MNGTKIITILTVSFNSFLHLRRLFLNLIDKSAKLLPLPHPISKILEFLSSFTCFNKKLLKDLMYFCEDSQVLLSQFFKDDINS